MALTTEFQRIGTGTSKTFGYATGYLELWAKHNEQDVANNRTSVTVELRLVVSGGYIGNYQSTYWSIGGSLSNDGDIGSGSYRSQTLGSAEGYVGHNSDGTGSVSFSGGFNPTAWEITLDVNGSATLPTIPRASSVSCSSPYIGDTATITIDRKSSSFRHTVTYHILNYNSLTGTIADKTSSTVLSFNTESLKSQIYALMPNAKSIAGTIRCRTYSGNTKIGDTQIANFNLYAKENECKPTVSGVVIDTNQDTINLTGDSSILVKNASKPKVTVSATSKYSSTISSYSINLNDGQMANEQQHTFDTINSSSITIDAFDSREYHNPQTIDLSNRIIDYVKLHFNTVDLQRPEGTSNSVILKLSGKFYNGSFGNVNQNNMRNIRVGDDLSGKTLYFEFPSHIDSLSFDSPIKVSDTNYIGINSTVVPIEDIYKESVNLYYNNAIDTTIYERVEQIGGSIISESSIQNLVFPSDFGIVTQINTDSTSYPYIFIEDLNSNDNVLTITWQYRESGSSAWETGGTLNPTIINNTFEITNFTLGNVFDYEKEYQFKIIANDLLMTVGNESKDVHVVTKGIAVVEIGDELVNVNGNLTIDDKVLDYIVESGTSGIWQYRKWNSGLAECWGTHTQSLTTSRTWGSLYRGDAFDLAYPFTFSEVPQETYGFSSNVSALALTYSQNNTTRTATYNAAYYQNATISINLNLYVRGKWK